MKLIALTGPKQVGKSTVARAIQDSLAVQDFVDTDILSFADPMRAMLKAIGVDNSSLVDQTKKESPIEGIGKSARYLMQTLGTDWGRNIIDENIWLWALQNRIELVRKNGAEVVVIDDCRFDNEAKWVKDNGGLVVRLTRSGIEYGVDSHESEQAVESFDISIDAGDEHEAARRIVERAY